MARLRNNIRREIFLAEDLEEWLIECFSRPLSQNKTRVPGCHVIPDEDELEAMRCVINALKMGAHLGEIKEALDGGGLTTPPTEAELNKDWLARATTALTDPNCEAEANTVRDLILADSDHTHTHTHNGTPV